MLQDISVDFASSSDESLVNAGFNILPAPHAEPSPQDEFFSEDDVARRENSASSLDERPTPVESLAKPLPGRTLVCSQQERSAAPERLQLPLKSVAARLVALDPEGLPDADVWARELAKLGADIPTMEALSRCSASTLRDKLAQRCLTLRGTYAYYGSFRILRRAACERSSIDACTISC